MNKLPNFRYYLALFLLTLLGLAIRVQNGGVAAPAAVATPAEASQPLVAQQ